VQVDVGYSPLSDREDQIIRVWTILSDHKEVLPAIAPRSPRGRTTRRFAAPVRARAPTSRARARARRRWAPASLPRAESWHTQISGSFEPDPGRTPGSESHSSASSPP
jgi:hypothetical protein